MVNLSDILSPHQYYLNPYSIPPMIVASLVFSLGLFIFNLERKSYFNRSLMYLCISSSIWLYANTFAFNSRLATTALFWAKIQYAGFILIPATILHIALTYTKRFPTDKSLVKVAYAISALSIILIGNKNFFNGLREYPWGFYPDAGILLTIVLAIMLFFPALGLLNLIGYYRLATDRFERKRTKYLIISFIFASFSYVDTLGSYGVNIYPFGYLALLCFVLSLTYSIIRYNNLMVEYRSRELEMEVREKTAEISQILGELRTTQLKLMETGKISALASLSAGILHQISQPITAIHGFAKFIKKEMKQQDPFYKAIGLMEEQSVYLKEMLEDLMELLRHREIKKENIDVNAPIKRAANLLTDELRIRRVDWDLVLGENLPQVYADTVHLQQIFMNIIVNAMEAMSTLPKGSSRYLQITSKFDRAADKIVITFKDNGPGIQEETQKQIFEPFFSTKTKGSGIGLALCKDLIAEHGGEISVESSAGKGATFTIKLPTVNPLAQADFRVQGIR